MSIGYHTSPDEPQGVTLLDKPHFNPSTTIIAAERRAASFARRLRLGIGLETRQLSRTVGGKALVSDFNLLVLPGEVLAVVGPSGADNWCWALSTSGR